LQESPLFKRVYGALIGSAIGDAMGGPVEMLPFEEIERKYGVVDELLPYLDKEPSAHGLWTKEAGSYTDDTRIARIYCLAIIEKGDVPTDKDIARAFVNYYHSATGRFSKDFIEEYYLKAIYREDKQIFGGQSTNAGIMGIAPFGAVNACNVQKAFDDAFKDMFVVFCGTGLNTSNDISSPDPEIRGKGLEYLVNCLEISYQIGSPSLRGVIHSAWEKERKSERRK